MNINKIINEEVIKLLEGRSDYEEIDRLSGYILDKLCFIVVDNIIELYNNKIFPLSHEILMNYNEITKLNILIFDTKSKPIKLNYFNNNEFERLGDFISNTTSVIYFSGDRLYGGSFNERNKKIEISIPNNNILKLINTKIKKLIKWGKTSNNQLKNLLHTEIIASNYVIEKKWIIQHEIQHSFDDYRSNSKIFNSKEDNNRKRIISKYYKKYYNTDNFNRDDMFNRYKEDYYNSPHEIWGYFTETMNKLFSYGQRYENFEELVAQFKIEDSGMFDILTKENKKKVLTALYKVYEKKGGK